MIVRLPNFMEPGSHVQVLSPTLCGLYGGRILLTGSYPFLTDSAYKRHH